MGMFRALYLSWKPIELVLHNARGNSEYIYHYELTPVMSRWYIMIYNIILLF